MLQSVRVCFTSILSTNSLTRQIANSLTRTLAISLTLAAIAFVVAHLLDAWAYAHLQMPQLAESDLGRMLRVLGYLPLWLVVALAMMLEDDPAKGAVRSRWRRGGLVMGAAVLGGVLAEAAKIVIRRQRPDAGVDGYVFRPWSEETFHTGGLGLPSSHALVAFAALAMLGYLFPRARPLWYALGAGCAYSRIASGAHFLSDVVASAILGGIVAWLLWRRFGTNGGTRLVPDER